jgi:hypothetical protein
MDLQAWTVSGQKAPFKFYLLSECDDIVFCTVWKKAFF